MSRLAAAGPALVAVPVECVREEVELCARHADALAGEVEAAERAVRAQLAELGRGDLVAANRTAWALRARLRVIAGSLGELHTTLDEAAHGNGGGS